MMKSVRNDPDRSDDRGAFISSEYLNMTGQTFKAILAVLWNDVAKPILDTLNLCSEFPPKRKQRIWWCPSGVLSFLPLHAAGLYGKDVALGSKLSDYVISSYTPTLSTLLDQDVPSPVFPQPTQPKVLVIANPTSKGQIGLPGAKTEKELIEEVIGPVSSLAGEQATLEEVEIEIKDSNWVHFACHGVQNAAEPSKSALLLAGDDRLTLENLASLRIPNGELAFLSACQTAKGDVKLSEEAVHLSAGMLVSGYKGVIATMWSVADTVAPRVAKDVYQHLKDAGMDPREAARALDLAVERERYRDGSSKRDDDDWFISWVPFIHLGR